MTESKKTYIQAVEKWLLEDDHLFKKSKHNEYEMVFLIYEDAINQSALLLELTINEEGTGNLLCTVVPSIPMGNIAEIEKELKKLNFIHNSFAEFEIVNNDIVAFVEFEFSDIKDCLFKVNSKLNTFKWIVDDVIPTIHYEVWREQ